MSAERNAEIFDVVRGHDPALYRWLDATRAAKYAVEREWSLLEGIPVGKDPQPIVFHCRVLSRKQRRTVRAAGTRDEQREMAYRYGVLSIRNAPTKGGPRNHTFVRDHESHALEDEALDEIERLYELGDMDILDIGEAVLVRSFLAQGVRRRCQLPDFSLEAARDLISRFHAERRKDAEAASSADTSDDTKGP